MADTNLPDTNLEVADNNVLNSNVKEVVREKYGEAALRVTNKTGGSSCCGSAPSSGLSCDPITALPPTVSEPP